MPRNSKLSGVRKKPRGAAKKPHPDFPLFPHATGRWAKKVKGKLAYFGKIAGDPKGEAALNRWLNERDDLLAGRKPNKPAAGDCTLEDLCNKFMAFKERLVDAGELRRSTWKDYHATCVLVLKHLGKKQSVSKLTNEDFESLRSSFSRLGGPVRLGKMIQVTRSVFKYGVDSQLLLVPVRYGQSFNRPSKKVMRLHRAARGKKLIEAAEIRQFLRAASPTMQAMILLGINAGMGNTDCGALENQHLDLDGGWLTYPRPKTGIDRRAKLWPETIAAIQVAMSQRPAAKGSELRERIFITKYGTSWAKPDGSSDPISREFGKLKTALKLDNRPGVGFYALRHTFRTIADEVHDGPACNLIMGHVDDSMAGVYRERIDDSRLVKISDYVRSWLFSEATDSPAAKPPKKK